MEEEQGWSEWVSLYIWARLAKLLTDHGELVHGEVLRRQALQSFHISIGVVRKYIIKVDEGYP
eukprot:7754447-Lingulodinium_polyedra.AAC.1